MNKDNVPILSLCQISKHTTNKDKKDNQVILDNINLEIHSGEVIALLGRSGAGKSTLLRLMAGLVAPSSGQILYKGAVFSGTTPNTTLVFQKPSLMPWLTIMENISLVLEAYDLSRVEKEKRTLDTITAIGLEGYENAYPNELSTGMCQRASIARSLVVRPDIMLMDEPFSSLDVLTIDSMWEDLFNVWTKGSIVFVTHNIEEAVLHANKILVLDGSPIYGTPGRICGTVTVDLPRERDFKSKEVVSMIDNIYFLIAHHGLFESQDKDLKKIRLTNMLPDADVPEFIGLLISMHDIQSNNIPIDLPLLAEHVELDIDDLFPIIEGLSLLQLVVLVQGDIVMTRIGKQFLEADMEDRKKIFAEQMHLCIPFTNICVQELLVPQSKHIEYFLKILSHSLGKDKSETFLKIFIRWGRYADIVGYDASSRILYIIQPSLQQNT